MPGISFIEGDLKGKWGGVSYLFTKLTGVPSFIFLSIFFLTGVGFIIIGVHLFPELPKLPVERQEY